MKIRNPFIWGGSGTTAGVVSYSQHGQQLLRSLPKEYNDKKSDTQLYQRNSVFKPLNSFCRSIKFYVNMLYQNPIPNKSKYAFFVHQVSPAFKGSYPTPGVNLKLAIVGNGDLPRVAPLTLIKATTATFTCTWATTKTSPFEQDSDLVLFLVTKPDGTVVKVIPTGVARSVGTYTGNVGPVLTGTSVNVSEPLFYNAGATLVGTAAVASSLSPVNLA